MTDFAPNVITLHTDEHLLCQAGSVGVKFRFDALNTSIMSMIEQSGMGLSCTGQSKFCQRISWGNWRH